MPKKPMLTAHEIRQNNLNALMSSFAGNNRKFADLLSLSPSFLGQIKRGATAGGRNIGGDLARKIETRIDAPRGWMDTPKECAVDPCVENGGEIQSTGEVLNNNGKLHSVSCADNLAYFIRSRYESDKLNKTEISQLASLAKHFVDAKS